MSDIIRTDQEYTALFENFDELPKKERLLRLQQLAQEGVDFIDSLQTQSSLIGIRDFVSNLPRMQERQLDISDRLKKEKSLSEKDNDGQEQLR
jgi:hypothetical protein